MSRDEILEAVKEASRIFSSHGDVSQGRLDLVSISNELEIPVLYRPLDNLWGGTVNVEGKEGILIKSNLPRYLQRFTFAHELGHVVLGHQNRFDDEVGLSQRAARRSDRPTKEVAADTFASELLANRNLIQKNAEMKGWSKEDLQDPKKIYQLSLRLGISFQATCWALVENNIIAHSKADGYISKDSIVKQTKNSFIPFTVSHESYADVWKLSKGDAEIQLEAGKEDLFKVELQENSSSGYRWAIKEDELDIVFDDSEFDDDYGSPASRTILFKLKTKGRHEVNFKHHRPWSDEVIERFTVNIENLGREEVGLPRQEKRNRIERASA